MLQIQVKSVGLCAFEKVQVGHGNEKLYCQLSCSIVSLSVVIVFGTSYDRHMLQTKGDGCYGNNENNKCT